MTVLMEERVNNLEVILGHFFASTGTSINRLEREMVNFKNEMLNFKGEMVDFKNDMKDFKCEINKKIRKASCRSTGRRV